MWWIGIVEGLGNATVVGVLAWRMKSTFKARWLSLTAWQASVMLWFTSNVFYALYFVMWEAFEIDWWYGLHYDLTKGAQQIAIMTLPLTTLVLMSQAITNFKKAAAKMEAT